MFSVILLRWHRATAGLAALVALLGFMGGCGGSGSGSTSSPSTPAPAPDFSISTSPSTLTLGQGGSQTTTVSVAAVNGFTANVSVSAGTLPMGVSATPATFSLAPGAQQKVTITASAAAQSGTVNLSFQGTSGTLSHSAQVSLSVTVQVSAQHPPLRTRYLRNNSFYDPDSLPYTLHFAVYDAAHKQFFVSNTYLNEIDVFDAVQQVETAQIPVPMPWGMDISPSNGALYAGTLIGDVYQIDIGSLTVTNRYPSASIGPSGFTATTALVLSDGRLALQGAAGYYIGVDPFGSLAVWDPATNALYDGADGSAGVCSAASGGAFALSGDRTRILSTWLFEGGGGAPVCSFDPVAQASTYGTFPAATFVTQIIPTPDGARFFLISGGQGIGVFDTKTVELLGQITGSNPAPALPNASFGAVVSQDGKTLYLNNNASGAVGSFDTTTFAQTGWISGFTVDDVQSSIAIAAVDETGLLIGQTGHGVGFLDASTTTPNQPTLFTSAYSSPSTGPLSGGTVLTGFATGNVTDSATLSEIYVGNVPGSSASLVPDSAGSATGQVTTPPSLQPGAVDLTLILSDGAIAIAPETFSYGPTILDVVPSAATAEGGQNGAIIGYGFGPTPSQVQVTVGGQAAQVSSIYMASMNQQYPVPAQALQFTLPPGTPGTAVDVTVTTPAGSATTKAAFNYTAPVTSFPVTANLQEGIYDSTRDVYYFTDTAQIQVLSKADGKWLSPITLPQTASATQLLAISESPDGSQLAVTDYGGQALYVLDPDTPTVVSRYPTPYSPTGLAVSNSGNIYFASLAGNALYKLTASTGSIAPVGLPNLEPGDEYVRVLQNSDGSRVYSSIEGITLWLDTTNDEATAVYLPILGGSFPELAISGDGSTVDVQGYLTDPSLDLETAVTYIDWETWIPSAAIGQKLNQDGSILFQPLTDGVDMIARNTGRLLYRVQIPVTPAQVYDPVLVAEGKNTLAIITTTGVSFVDLSSLPLPTGDAQPFPNSARNRGDSKIRPQANSQIRHGLDSRSKFMNARPGLREGVKLKTRVVSTQ